MSWGGLVVCDARGSEGRRGGHAATAGAASPFAACLLLPVACTPFYPSGMGHMLCLTCASCHLPCPTRRLGLYHGLKEHGPCTAADLASALGLNER